MAIESTRRTKPQAQAHVSQGSRAMAQPAFYVGKFETYADEKKHLLLELDRIDAEMAGYSQTAILAEQGRIRKQGGGVGAWIKRKTELEDARRKLSKERVAVQNRLSEIKPLVVRENVSASTPTPSATQEKINIFAAIDESLASLDDSMKVMVSLLTEIRDSLKSKEHT